MYIEFKKPHIHISVRMSFKHLAEGFGTHIGTLMCLPSFIVLQLNWWYCECRKFGNSQNLAESSNHYA